MQMCACIYIYICVCIVKPTVFGKPDSLVTVLCCRLVSQLKGGRTAVELEGQQTGLCGVLCWGFKAGHQVKGSGHS